MSDQPPQRPRTFLGTVSQLVQRTQLNFSKVELRRWAKVPEIRVENPESSEQSEKTLSYPLVGDRYIIGRSSRSCDIIVPNPIVSQVHVSLNRNRRQGTGFTIRDEGSTNGFYWGKKRYNSLELRHGDVISLGPPELANGARLRFYSPPPLYKKVLKYGFYGVSGVALLGALVIGIEWQKFSTKQLGTVAGPIAAYAGDGTPLQTLRSASHVELRRLSDFSPYLPKAVVASEDSRFYWHVGFDPLRVASAMLINLRSGGIREGASTVTQQISRSLYPDYVGKDDSALRKVREIIVAMKLETFYSKDFLLKTYLNRVYLGVGYGFEDAAQKYFNKSAADLTLSESATLVGILPAPNSFSPCSDIETATGLRNRVITRMFQLGMVSEEEAQAGRRSAIVIDPAACQTSGNILSPYFYGQIYDELQTLLGREVAREGNFIIETELDLNLQKQAEESLRAAVRNEGPDYGFSQGAIATIDAGSGAILALVGGVDYSESQFNRATQALRQPGSTFKTIAYAAALDQGISPYQGFSCAPLNWGGQSYSGCERSSGTIDMFRALSQSENSVSLRIAQEAGLEAVGRTARELGIQSDLRLVPGLVLGQSEVTVLEMAGVYSAFANGGQRVKPHAITRILDSGQCADPNDRQTCRVVFDIAQAPNANAQVLDPGIAQTLTQMLQDSVSSGTGRAAFVPSFNVAGKTGTTNSGVDLWFVGFVPSRQLVTSVWLGNDDNTPTRGSSGNAAGVWGDYMKAVLR